MKHWHLSRLFILLWLSGCSITPAGGGHVAPHDAFAQLQTLNADLLSHDSATLTLERWCSEHHLADPPRVVARRIRDGDRPIPDALRAELQVDAMTPIAYRHVQLVCGEHVLSEADNWYVPDRLTPEMNRRLDTTDEPFGKVVKPLGFRRHTLTAQLLWRPGVSERAPPRDLLRHTAVLYSAEQMPFSVVVETYQSGLFKRADTR